MDSFMLLKRQGCFTASLSFCIIHYIIMVFQSSIAACAAAIRAIGTRNGEQDT